jgi:hypothetical protein
MSYLTFVKTDFDGDAKQVTWHTLTDSDFADYDTYRAAMVNLDASITAWSIGRDIRTDISQLIVNNVMGAASSPVAQGALRLILEGQDTTTGQIYKFPIPMPDTTKANDGDGDPAWVKVGQGSNSLTVMNSAHADYATLKTRFEATVLSPNDNPCVLVRGYIEE